MPSLSPAFELHPCLYQINTRVYLNDLSRQLNRRAGLDDIPDAELDTFARLGFQWVWLLGLWQTGSIGREISQSNPEWIEEYRRTLPEFSEADVTGSPFAVCSYTVHKDFDASAVSRFQKRLARRDIALLADFVPNHSAIDHPWVESHPEYYIAGTPQDLAQQPANYRVVQTKAGERIFAHGRDPYFPGWPDTLQLNYRCRGLQEAMIRELLQIAEHADGVRCDMAMLVEPEIFQRTWGDRALPSDKTPPCDRPFWTEAIARVRERYPSFVFMAEVYWDMEWTLQQRGFDFTYDKRLYDRLMSGSAAAIRGHLDAAPDFQQKSVRFLENHDEPRVAARLGWPQHQAAATISFLLPGLSFLHEGQLDGRMVKVSPHLGRRPHEPEQPDVRHFYEGLLAGRKQLGIATARFANLSPREAWDGNPTYDQFVSFFWARADGTLFFTVVNYGKEQGQCRIRMPLPGITAASVSLVDQLSGAHYDRETATIRTEGLFVDMPPWGYHLFRVGY